jgi:hypothetical protein
MNKKIYFKVSRYENNQFLGSYIEEKVKNAIELELNLSDVNEYFDNNIEIRIKPIKLTEEEFENLPDFKGY